MRLMIKFESVIEFTYDSIGKYDIQGFIYSLLKDTQFGEYHNLEGFKFFNFSNIFPITDFKPGNVKNIIISSPNNALIKLLAYQLKDKEFFRLNNYMMKINSVKTFHLRANSKIITATPIVLFEDNRANRYFSFKNNDFDFFFERLKDNAIKKYNAFYDDDFEIDSMNNIFDSFSFRKEVSMRMHMKQEQFIIIGSIWTFEKDSMLDKKFYDFLFDTGYGEKNSLGMGFVNNWK